MCFNRLEACSGFFKTLSGTVRETHIEGTPQIWLEKEGAEVGHRIQIDASLLRTHSVMLFLRY